ncbi:acyl-CoA dehydrogenase [Nannocystis pusilla]|uniref:Acyl-CoA dehydrogenase n=1 Tax=Nannocystis pusilla TaxID=889268 RepID=A0A9X3J0P7_9BACT|nr:acyl-CoA dehydrogenase [Nannocystis pusilla]MCY1009268.1 acyl-CoA dehydrogenase [Nannocystis pusilla]
MQWERSCLFAGYVGMLERQLAQAVEYARTRRQGGKPIGKHQAVAHRLAEMKLRLESARLLLYRACWLRDRGAPAVAEVSLAKLAISEAARLSSLDAIQIHGGIGFAADYNVEHMLRDSVPATLFSGTSEIQRDLIAREMGL